MHPTLLDDIRWILFDAVGTLIYADPPVAEVYHAAATRFGSRLNVGEIHDRFPRALAAEQQCGLPTSEENERQRWRRIVDRVIDDVPEAGEAIFEQLWRHFAQPESWRLYEDVPAALDMLAQRGYQLGIASNFD